MFSIKLTILKLTNSILQLFGVQIYKKGIDMESVLRQMSKNGASVKTVIDIGASNGRWSKMGMDYFTDSRFIAIDPLKEREPQLKKLKEARPNFDYILCVAGEKKNDTVNLIIGEDLDGSTVGGGSNGISRTVPSHSIDAIVKMKNLEGPFCIKFDTHGYEVPILRGASETLKNTDYIVMEVYNYRHTPETLLFYEMCDYLKALDFRCFSMADPMLRPLDNTLWQMDFFFARTNNPIFKNENYQ
jgi:FkbM family methyltransferase